MENVCAKDAQEWRCYTHAPAYALRLSAPRIDNRPPLCPEPSGYDGRDIAAGGRGSACGAVRHGVL